jgi:MYXO-CTERM domain-containing protein
VLPTGDAFLPAGAANQYQSIWNDAGGSFVGLSSKFDGVQSGVYWSGTEYAPNPSLAWSFGTFDGSRFNFGKSSELYAVAVLPGDVAVVPEPQGVALAMAALGVLAVVRRRRPR